MKIIRGKIKSAKKIVVYGPEGIGKSTFASKFPTPLFIDTEKGTKDLDVIRFEPPSSWEMLLAQVRYVQDNPDCCETLVLDTADWAEQIEINDLLNIYEKTGLEDFGYGKGYTYSAERIGKLLNELEGIINKGIHVVITAHAQLRKIELPEEMGAYDHWEMKTSKKVAPLIREWADMVLFANYKVNIINVDNQGAIKGKNKAQGGSRVMYTTHTPFWDAKNRHNLPNELPFEFEGIRHIFTESTEKNEAVFENEKLPNNENQISIKSNDKFEEEKKVMEPVPDTEEQISTNNTNVQKDIQISMKIPKALRDLMIENNVDEWDIQGAVAAKGYYPADVPVYEYDSSFIDGVLIGAWPQVYSLVTEIRKKEEIPF